MSETFKDRLQTEKSELDTKINALATFIGSDAYTKIDNVQQTLLNIQYQSMLTYSQCLLERLVRL